MTEQEESLSLTSIIECGHRGDSRWVAESRVQELEGERDDLNRLLDESIDREKVVESRLARLEEAGNGLAALWREIAPGFLPDRYNDLVDERTEAWSRSLLTHSTSRQQLVEACQRAIRRGDKKVAEDLDREINEMDSQAADD